MNKNRIEALSDGVFAIVMTLLIIDIKVPHGISDSVSDAELWRRLMDLWPLVRSYVISFLMLGTYWMAHHAFFHMFAKNVDRKISYLNILYLMFIACIPFSAHLLGQYPSSNLAINIYAANIIMIGLILFMMFRTIVRSSDLKHAHVSRRWVVQATIRIFLPPVFAIFGILAARVSISLTYGLFIFPFVFNAIPGGLNILENIFLKRKNYPDAAEPESGR